MTQKASGITMHFWAGEQTQHGVLNTDVDAAAAAFRDARSVRLDGAVRGSFLVHARKDLDRQLATLSASKKLRLASRRMTLPEPFELERELLGPVSEVFGVRTDRLTLHERRYLVFSSGERIMDSPVLPCAADELVVLIPLHTDPETRVRLVPRKAHGEAGGLFSWRQAWPRRRLSFAGGSFRPVALGSRDALAFDATTTELEVLKPGNSRFLRLSFNRCGYDPYFDDPRSEVLCLCSTEVLPRLDDTELPGLSVRLSPRLGSLEHLRLKRSGRGLYRTQLARGDLVTLSRMEYELLEQLQWPRRIDLIRPGTCGEARYVVPVIRHLIRSGLVVFAEPRQAALRAA